MRWVITGALLMVCAPAAAEDWWHVATEGDAPARKAGIFDADSIDRTDPMVPRVNSALLTETPDEVGDAVTIATFALDCDAATSTIVFIDMRDFEGETLAAGPLEDQPFNAIEAGSHLDVLRLAVCEDQWQWPDAVQFGKGKTLSQISAEVFRE